MSMKLPVRAQERFLQGHLRRKHMRRREHAAWTAENRREDPLELLRKSTHGRIPALVALKYERMETSPFGYFRGAVPVMAYDLSVTGNTGILSQLCGDAHIRNLGAYAGLDGRIVFNINDFDETIVGPFEWDVKRMATSLILAGREAGITNGNCHEVALVFLENYRRYIAAFARLPVLEVARFQVHRLHRIAAIDRILKAAQRATPLDTVQALTVWQPGPQKTGKTRTADSSAKSETGKPPNMRARIFKTIPPVLKRIKSREAEQVLGSLKKYVESLSPERRLFFSQYKPLDVSFKVVGTGSVGLRDYCIYMEGNGPKDPLFLQIKEEVESEYAPYLNILRGRKRSARAFHQGRRVVEGARLMQLQSDPFLGWTTMEGRHFLVRQLNDHKASIELKSLTQAGLTAYAEVCGEMLARGHARSGDSQILAGYLGRARNFDAAVARFANAYADQTEKDWRELVRSRKKK